MVISSDLRIKKRSERVLRNLNSVIGKELPRAHKVITFEKFGATIISAHRGRVEIECEVIPDMANPLGFLHGGVQCILIDDVIALTAITLGNRHFPISVNLQINFLSKARVGNKLRIKAKITQEGNKIINASAKIVNNDGKLIAVGQTILLNTQISRDPKNS
ncbi:MAG: PaaI family thioesterase [Promethearchaeota archaeon]